MQINTLESEYRNDQRKTHTKGLKFRKLCENRDVLI